MEQLNIYDELLDDQEFTTRLRVILVREATAPYSMNGRYRSLSNPHAVARFLDHLIGNADREHLGAIYLDNRQRGIGHTIAYVGTINRCSVEPRGILVPGLLCNAVGIVLFHNHPSGDPSPSTEDLRFTRRCAEAAELLGMRLVDHLIIGDPGHFTSLRERGGW